MQENQLDISGLNAKAETALGILFREGFKTKSETFTKSMGRTGVVVVGGLLLDYGAEGLPQ